MAAQEADYLGPIYDMLSHGLNTYPSPLLDSF